MFSVEVKKLFTYPADNRIEAEARQLAPIARAKLKGPSFLCRPFDQAKINPRIPKEAAMPVRATGASADEEAAAPKASEKVLRKPSCKITQDFMTR